MFMLLALALRSPPTVPNVALIAPEVALRFTATAPATSPAPEMLRLLALVNASVPNGEFRLP
jgi:hypothetical protein